MLASIYFPVSWIRYNLVPVSRIELGGSNGGIQSEENFSPRLRKMAQPETGEVRTTESEGDKLQTPSDDEEITIPSQDSADIRNVDIRDEQSENTQREDWLLPTESRHWARPRQTGAEHPPAMEDSVFRDAAGVPAVRHPNRTLCLLPARRIFMEKEVFHTSEGGGGGRQVPEP